MVSEKSLGIGFRKIWYQKKSLGIGFGQNFGIVIQWLPMARLLEKKHSNIIYFEPVTNPLGVHNAKVCE